MNEISPIDIDHVIDKITDTVVSEYKDCTKCGVSKLKNCFNKDKGNKDGLYCRCKDCVKAKDAKRYQENKDEINAHNAKPENKAKKAEYNDWFVIWQESTDRINEDMFKKKVFDMGAILNT